MGLAIASSMAVKAYCSNREAWGQTDLKQLMEYGGYYVQHREELDANSTQTESMLIGSIVDIILLHEAGAFEREYHIQSIPEDKIPSDKEQEIAQAVLAHMKEKGIKTFLEVSDEDLLAILDAKHWQPKWKTETRLAKIREAIADYIEELIKAEGKTVITNAQYETAMLAVNRLRNHPMTQHLFQRSDLELRQRVFVYYQLPIYWAEKVKQKEKDEPIDIKCKALLDMLVIVRDEEGRILSAQGIDLKTTSLDAKFFPASLRKFRYDIQAMFYEHAIEKFLKMIAGGMAKETKIKPFQFAVVSTAPKPSMPVMLYTRNNEIAMTGWMGIDYYDDMLVKHRVIGYEELLKRLAYYRMSNGKEVWDDGKTKSIALGWYTINEDPFGDLNGDDWPDEKPNPKQTPICSFHTEG